MPAIFGLNNLSIDFLSENFYLSLLATIVLVASVFWLYHKTNPPIKWQVKSLLIILRFVAVFSIGLALLEPVISYENNYERKKRIAVVRDYSLSMDKIENGSSRSEKVDSILASESFEALTKDVELRNYFFGNNLVADKSIVDREKTAIGDIFSRLQQIEIESNSDYILLMSDGRSNSGKSFKSVKDNINSPIVAINFSAPDGNFDIAISEINFNPVIFAGEETEIELKISWKTAIGKSAKIELFDKEKLISTRNYKIEQEDGLANFKLKYRPDRAGQKILSIRIPSGVNEENKENNKKTFSLKVLKSKLKIMIVSNSPDYETSFLKRELEKSSKYEIVLIVIGSNSGNLKKNFPSKQTVLNQYDLVILHNPTPSSLSNRKEIIKSYLSDKGGSIWVLLGNNYVTGKKETWFDNMLPFSFNHQRNVPNRVTHLVPSENHLFHPAIRVAETLSEIRSAWQEMPPFQYIVNTTDLKQNAVVLATIVDPIDDNKNIPAIAYIRDGPGKIMATTVSPFWKWEFQSSSDYRNSRNTSGYSKFIEGLTSWLTITDDYDPIKVSPQKSIFTRGEKVAFDGYAYDLGFRPLTDVSGVVKVVSDSLGYSLETDLLSDGQGKLSAEFSSLKSGKYHYQVRIEKEGRVLKEVEGDLVVESYLLEQYDQSGDIPFLKTIAQESGGKFFEYYEFDKALEFIDNSSISVSEKKEVLIWNQASLLFLIIGCFSLEWLIRKINQML